MHWPGIEPGPPAWQARILPLNHQCFRYCLSRSRCTHSTERWKRPAKLSILAFILVSMDGEITRLKLPTTATVGFLSQQLFEISAEPWCGKIDSHWKHAPWNGLVHPFWSKKGTPHTCDLSCCPRCTMVWDKAQPRQRQSGVHTLSVSEQGQVGTRNVRKRQKRAQEYFVSVFILNGCLLILPHTQSKDVPFIILIFHTLEKQYNCVTPRCLVFSN